MTLGYPSGSAFRNTCQRYLHATPGEIRARGGAAYAVRALLRQVQAKNPANRMRSRSAARSLVLAV